MGGQKHSLIVIEPRQRQEPPVSFHNIYIFENIIHIAFILENQNTYTVPTLVLTRVCQPWVMHHVDTPTTLPELTSPKQPRWSEISVSPYAASNSGRP